MWNAILRTFICHSYTTCSFSPLSLFSSVDIWKVLDFLETKLSLICGLICKCETASCVGTLMFDRYREEDFQRCYYQLIDKHV
jgi:hypothetical protein